MEGMSSKTEAILQKSGWTPGRKVDVSELCQALERSGFSLSGPVIAFYEEFYGIHVPDGGVGVSRARESVDFDPRPCLGEQDFFNDWGAEVDRTMSPLGQLDGIRYLLGIDETLQIYVLDAWLASFGVGALGMDNLILGVMPETIREE